MINPWNPFQWTQKISRAEPWSETWFSRGFCISVSKSVLFRFKFPGFNWLKYQKIPGSQPHHFPMPSKPFHKFQIVQSAILWMYKLVGNHFILRKPTSFTFMIWEVACTFSIWFSYTKAGPTKSQCIDIKLIFGWHDNLEHVFEFVNAHDDMIHNVWIINNKSERKILNF